MKWVWIIALFILIQTGFAQSDAKKYHLTIAEQPLEQAILDIAKLAGYKPAYIHEMIPDTSVTISFIDQTPISMLYQLLRPFGLTFEISEMDLILYSSTHAPESYQIFGIIQDSVTGEVLVGANVFTNRYQGNITDKFGLYSIHIIPDQDSLIFFTYLGYKTKRFRVNDLSVGRYDIKLKQETSALPTITIVVEDEIGKPQIPPTDIFKSPAYGLSRSISGTLDPIEHLNTMPGVVKMSEGRSGYSIHGSATDQNLILIDEAPVFNPSHALGFLSIFNQDVINTANFYKHGIPARYGGRLSSVLDVRLREGQPHNMGISINTNPYFSGISIDGPIIKNRLTFLLSGRHSHLRPILSFVEPKKGFYVPKDINFYDVNIKFNLELNKNNRLYLSSFLNNDHIRPFNSTTPIFLYDTNWKNRTGTLRWHSIWNDRLSTNASIIYSDYQYHKFNSSPDGLDSYSERSSIAHTNVKAEMQYYYSKNRHILAGINFANYTFHPASGYVSFNQDSIKVNYDVPSLRGQEYAFFIEDNLNIGSAVTVSAGLRYSIFQDIGNDRYEYTYDHLDRIIDSTFLQKGKVIHSFSNWEPRLAVNVQLNDNWLLQSSYSRTSQYIMRLLNENPSIPNEYWLPVGSYLQPLTSKILYSRLQYERNQQTTYSVGAFYRESQNVTAFKDGANILFSEHLIDKQITQGSFRSKGLEYQMQHYSAQFRWQLSYTLSDVRVRFHDINQGQEFNAPFNFQHEFNCQASFDMSPRVQVGFNWQWRSGDLISIPTGVGYIAGIPYDIYRSRNNFRIPSFNRLDVMANIALYDGEKSKIQVNVGLYNLLGRMNAFQVRIEPDIANPRLELLALTQMVPFININWRWR